MSDNYDPALDEIARSKPRPLLFDDEASVERLAAALRTIDDEQPMWLVVKLEDLAIDDSAAVPVARALVERLRGGA